MLYILLRTPKSKNSLYSIINIHCTLLPVEKIAHSHKKNVGYTV